MGWLKNVGLKLLLGCFLAGCSKNNTNETPNTGYRIVATVGMVADIARNVSGELAQVHNIIGEGVDPHLYKPTRNDIAALMRGDVVFYSGLKLEGKMGDILEKISAKGRPVVAVTEDIDSSYLLTPDEGGGGHHDPHVWMDVQGWMKATEKVRDVLIDYDAEHAEVYRSNAASYLKKLESLDVYVRTTLGSIPEQARVLITAHDAFGYFGRAYGLEVVGIQGLSTESEAGLEDINRLVQRLVAEKIQAVFVETSVADKNVRALIEGAKASGWNVKIGGSLFSDAMGAPGTYEGTYIGMIDHNATIICTALGGTPAERTASLEE